MSITINNSVINQRGTPSIITDVNANLPLANQVPVGTVFFSIDTLNIYQTHLLYGSPIWYTMGGGGGGTQNLNSVLAQGGSLTDNRSIEGGGYNLYFNDFNNFFVFSDTNIILQSNTSYFIGVGEFIGIYQNSSDFYFGAGEEIGANGFIITYDEAPNIYVRLGDFAGTAWKTNISIDQNFTLTSGGGDLSPFFECTYFLYSPDITINDDNYTNLIEIGNVTTRRSLIRNLTDQNNIYTTDANTFGFGFDIQFDTNTLRLGAGYDYIGTYMTNISIFGSTGIIRYDRTQKLEITNSTNLISTTAGANSTAHLKITINGTDYKIQLKNP